MDVKSSGCINFEALKCLSSKSLNLMKIKYYIWEADHSSALLMLLLSDILKNISIHCLLDIY